MKYLIVTLLAILLFAVPSFALENDVPDHTHNQYVEDEGGDEEKLLVLGTAISGVTLYALNSNNDNNFQNFLVSFAVGATLAMSEADDSGEAKAAVAGALFGSMLSQYIWFVTTPDKSMVGITYNW